MMSQRASRRKPASGFVLAMVLVCLTVITLALTAMVSRMSQGHRQLAQRQRQLQARWLAESAVERAAAQLRLDPSYRGETWHLTAAEISGQGSAQILIQIELSAAASIGWIQVTVRYPDRDLVAIHIEKRVPIRIPNVGEAT